MPKPAAFAITVGGFIAGVFDLTYAIVISYFRGVAPLWVIQSVASGILGNAAFKGGYATAFLGVLLHFFIACSAATIFYLASRKIDFLTKHAIVSGLIYGAVIYAVMYLIVLPLSAYPIKINFALNRVVINLIVHMFFIGLPIALVVRKASHAE